MRVRSLRVLGGLSSTERARRVHQHIAHYLSITNATDAYIETDSRGIAAHVEYRDALGWLLTFPQRQPYLFNLFCAVACKVVGDLLVQLLQRTNSKQSLDWRRLCVFFIFGLLYVGVFEWYIYVEVYSFLLPNTIKFANEPLEQKLLDRPGQSDYLLQVLLDNLLVYTILYLPAFYLLKELIQGPSMLRLEAWSKAFRLYRANLPMDTLCCWFIWIPGDLIVFAVPMWLRMPMNHLICFVWTVVLSYLRGAEVEEVSVGGRLGKKHGRKVPAALGNDGLVRAL